MESKGRQVLESVRSLDEDEFSLYLHMLHQHKEEEFVLEHLAKAKAHVQQMFEDPAGKRFLADETVRQREMRLAKAKALKNMPPAQRKRQKIFDVFDSMDVNGSGGIDASEFRHALR